MARRSLQFVIKISKLCNLRCSYCYEFNELGDKRKISLEDFERLFRGVAAFAVAEELEEVVFTWHGGEPFLIKTDYYDAIGALQRRVFPSEIKVTNSVQTNLTILTEPLLAFLESGRFFDGIGVSFDAYGDQRVDRRGKLRTGLVLDNMQRLLDRDIPFGAISVLSRQTVDRATNTYRFFDALEIPCRFLPFYRSAGADQNEAHALTSAEILTSLKALFDAWLVSENGTPVDPIDDYIGYAVDAMRGEAGARYDKAAAERVFIVNTDGATWGVSETYDERARYGNLFDEPFDRLLQSPGRETALAASRRRLQRHCGACPFFGSCPGGYVAEATPEQERVLRDTGCPVRELIGYIISRLETSNLAPVVHGKAPGRTPTNDALAIEL